MSREMLSFRRRCLSPAEGKAAAERALLIPVQDRQAQAEGLHLDDPETLLSITKTLVERGPSSPAAVLTEADFFYRYLDSLQPQYPLDPFRLDEHSYFLGETARIAGTMCRDLSRREEARRWFDRSESALLSTVNPAANLAKLSYQRLALKTEERQFEDVLELLPRLIKTFEEQEMPVDALKCRFLEGLALRETDRLDAAVKLYGEIAGRARRLGEGKLLGSAYVDLMQIHAFLGNVETAFDLACEATPLLRQFNNRIDLAKLQLGLGYLLRKEGKLAEAIEAFRVAQREFAELQMRADIAANQLVVADLLLEANQAQQAEWEIRAALPVIEEYELVPESYAALSLLRESLRRRQIDRQALRDLHGYFRDEQ
jgi:tetratricopeptide (TPR) repeat protein